MAHTIPTAVSALGDAFEAVLLDSARVTSIDIGADATVTHGLADETTLLMIAVGPDASAAAVTVFRGEVFSAAKAWPLSPGYHPFGVPGGSRSLHFSASADTVITVLEN
ncbi:hypothetical protein [Rhizobium pisi]|uniref:hypothetical protein n=1 Tax=Rhizobium pisi TaxID=574561 RepID=UPI003D061CB7